MCCFVTERCFQQRISCLPCPRPAGIESFHCSRAERHSRNRYRRIDPKSTRPVVVAKRNEKILQHHHPVGIPCWRRTSLARAVQEQNRYSLIDLLPLETRTYSRSQDIEKVRLVEFIERLKQSEITASEFVSSHLTIGGADDELCVAAFVADDDGRWD